MKRKKKTAGAALPLTVCLVAFLLLAFGVVYYFLSRGRVPETPTEAPIQTETVPRNTYDPELFSKEDGRMHYPGAMTGVDVSAHQQEIDWNKVRADGVDFAIIRVGYRGYTEGGLFEDEAFRDNMRGALDAGLKVGLYFFSQATSVEEAEEEAEFTVQAAKKYGVSLPVFFDWEQQQKGRTAEVLLQDVSDYAIAFCRTVEAAGYRGGVYFNQVYGYSFRLEELRQYEFWLAEYRDSLSFYYEVDIWQYACKGTVDGIDLQVDLNLYFPKEER